MGKLLWAQYVLLGYINCREFVDQQKSCYLVNKNSLVVVSASICGLASVHQGKDVEFISMWGYPTEEILSSTRMVYLYIWQLGKVIDHKIQ